MRAASDLLLALPFAGLLLQGFRPPWAWAGAAAAIWGAAWALRRQLSFRPFALWLPWLAWAAISAFASGQPARSLPALSRAMGTLAFLAIAPQLWDERRRRVWLRALLGCALILAAAGAATGGRYVLQGGTGNAMTGLLPPYYNYTAFVLAAAFAAAAALLGRKDPDGARWGPLSKPALAVAAAWLTAARSRGALLAALAGAAAAALRQGRARRLLPAAGALAAAALLVTGFMVARGVASPAFLLKPERSQAFKRPQLWRAAMLAAAERPLLGDGPGQFEKGFRRHVFPAGFGLARYWLLSDHAHSEPAELAAETGWVGAALFAAALWASLTGPAGASLASQAAFAAAAAMAAQCAVDNMLQIPSLALLLAGALVCAKARQVHVPERWAGRAWGAAAAVGLALAAAAPLTLGAARRWSDESGAPGERLARAERLIRLYPAEPAPREQLARALMAQQPPDYEGAAYQLRRAAELAPFNAFYLVWRAELVRALGRPSEAEALALRALQLEPDFLQARLLVAEAQARSGRRAQARRELDDVAARRDRLAPRLPTGYAYVDLVASFDEKRYELVRALVEPPPRRR